MSPFPHPHIACNRRVAAHDIRSCGPCSGCGALSAGPQSHVGMESLWYFIGISVLLPYHALNHCRQRFCWHGILFHKAVCNSQSEIDFRESSKTVVVWQKTILRILTPWREGRAAKPHVLYFPPKPTQSCHGRVAKPHHLDRKVLYKTKTCVILPCRPVQLRVICHDFSFCLFVCFHETAFKCIRYVRYCLTCNPYNGSESQYKRSQQIHSASRNDVSMTTSCPVPPVIWQFSKSRIMVHEILSSFLF